MRLLDIIIHGGGDDDEEEEEQEEKAEKNTARGRRKTSILGFAFCWTLTS